MYRNSCVQPSVQNSYKRPDCSVFDNATLAMANVPMQKLQNLYDIQTAYPIGTIFPELNKPFKSMAGGKQCNL